MELPLIIVNFKLYPSATCENAVQLAKIHEQVADETGANIGVAVNAVDLKEVCEAVAIPVFAQHIDPVCYGSNTGHVSAKLVKAAGAYGTLLNHAECQMENEDLQRSLEMAREAGLFTVVCANTPEKGGMVAEWDADLIAVEPPELIGGDVSVSKSGPEIIERAVELVGEGRLLVGAGIRDSEDVQIALELGASGVLLASGVTKAEDPYAALKALVAGLG